MSYSSSSNSALYHPNGYIAGAIGSIISPTINVVPVASGAVLQPVAATTLPKGRWLITGTLFPDSTAGGATITGNTTIAKDAVVFWETTNAQVSNGISVSLSAVVDSDGTAVITIPMTYTTSDASTYRVTAPPFGLVQYTRIA